MCFILIGVHTVPGAPLVVAANREEFFNRPTRPPGLDPGPPRVFCGVDERAGGAWLGVNEYGLLVAVTNRYDRPLPPIAKSRGQLCRMLLDAPSHEFALREARAELDAHPYAGVNLLTASIGGAALLHAGADVRSADLSEGWHVLTNADLDDPHDVRHRWAEQEIARAAPDSVDEFLKAATRICSTPLDPAGESGIVLRGADRGTVSSMLVTLAKDPSQRRFLYAADAPDPARYADLSAALSGFP